MPDGVPAPVARVPRPWPADGERAEEYMRDGVRPSELTPESKRKWRNKMNREAEKARKRRRPAVSSCCACAPAAAPSCGRARRCPGGHRTIRLRLTGRACRCRPKPRSPAPALCGGGGGQDLRRSTAAASPPYCVFSPRDPRAKRLTTRTRIALQTPTVPQLTWFCVAMGNTQTRGVLHSPV